nr:hypothetical protein [Tanacetum cinerariifolium]
VGGRADPRIGGRRGGGALVRIAAGLSRGDSVHWSGTELRGAVAELRPFPERTGAGPRADLHFVEGNGMRQALENQVSPVRAVPHQAHRGESQRMCSVVAQVEAAGVGKGGVVRVPEAVCCRANQSGAFLG